MITDTLIRSQDPTARVQYIFGGRRCGKTTALVDWAVDEYTKNNCGIYVMAPTRQMRHNIRHMLNGKNVYILRVLPEDMNAVRGWSMGNMIDTVAIVDEFRLFKDPDKAVDDLMTLNPGKVMITFGD